MVIPASSICRTDQKTREAFPKYFHTPIVTLNSQIKDYPFVVYNNKKSVYNAVSYMIEKNHCQHIGIITGYDSGVTAKQRLAGYQEALSSHDMPFEEKYILSTPGYNIDSENLMNKWLQEKPELDGIMCVTDDIAYYLYRELEKLGKRVGKDIMVSGFDDKPESTHMVPPLASCMRMLMIFIEMLLHRIDTLMHILFFVFLLIVKTMKKLKLVNLFVFVELKKKVMNI